MSTFKEITKEQIKKWKQTKGKLKQVSIPIDGEVDKTANFIICKPTRNVLSALTDAGAKKDSEKSLELLFNNCILGGDMDLIESESADFDTPIYLAVLEEVGNFMQAPKVKSKYI